RRLLWQHRSEPALAVGSYHPLTSPPDVFAYLRRHAGTAFLVLLNFSSESRTWGDSHGCGKGRVVISTLDPDADHEVDKRIELRGDEGLLIRLKVSPPDHPRSNIG